MAIKLDKLALFFVISISFGLRFEQEVETAGIDFVILGFGNAIRTRGEEVVITLARLVVELPPPLVDPWPFLP